MTDETDTPLQSLLDQIESNIQNGEATDLRTVIESFGNRAFGPVLLLCGLFLLTPFGIIPGVPVALGVIVIAFAVQLLARRTSPWMPKWIGRVKITAKRVEQVQAKSRPILARIDGVIRPRQQWAATGPMQVLAAVLAMILAVTLGPLGAIPFAVCAPGLVLGLLGLGITARDGVVMLIGMTLGLGALLGVALLLL